MRPLRQQGRPALQILLEEITACSTCAMHLECGPKPVLQAGHQCKIAIIGQAPGLAVHKSGIPWLDRSGDNLREWLALDESTFYDSTQIALIPMGFCYPGKGKTGDLPPRIECAPLWHNKLFQRMPDIRLTLLIGKYSQAYYLGNHAERSLTMTVRNFKRYLPSYFVLPHPSPRNNIWMAKNPWFREEVIPVLRLLVKKQLIHTT